MHSRTFAFAAVCLSLSSLSGCALVGREARLQYPPKADEAETVVPVATPGPDAPAVRLSVTDARPVAHNYVGEVRNGFGMHTADVTTNDDVQAWVQSALEFELRAVGVRVAAATETVPLLSVRVDKVHCDAYFSYGAEVSLVSALSEGKGRAYGSSHTGQGGAGMNWTATETSYSLSLSLALQEVARKVATEVKGVLTLPLPTPPVPPSA